MNDWVIWAVLLVVQQAAFTVVSRARNTKGVRGLWYSAIASVFSNGIWFGSQLFIVSALVNAKNDLPSFFISLLFYVFFCVIGSVGMHWWLLKLEAKHNIQHG